MNDLLGMVRSFGIGRLAAVIGVTAGVAIALFLVAARLSEPDMGVLYADLDLTAGEQVVARLEQDGVKYELKERGGAVTILAPQTDIARLKVALAGEGLIARTGSVGYEIFDKTDAFGQTSFQQTVNRLRALEGELARTIAGIEGVRSARVHLVLPERELFAREEKQATASIVVEAPSGLDRRAVRAIVNLAASAVPGLAPARVTVLDSAGDLLASGQAGDDALALGGGVDERIAATEARLRRTVEDIVGRIVGPENLRVQVAADLDFSRVTETANIIDPDSQTVLSSSIVEDNSNSTDPALSRGVTVANALPSAAVVDPAAAANATAAARRTEETTNYEMTRTVRNEVKEMGDLKRLSVAVALNQQTIVGADGVAASAPRSDEELERIASLVRSAIGYNPARGDLVEIVEVPFRADAPTSEGASAAADARLSPASILRLAEFAALAAIALALIVFVLRPMLAGARSSAPDIPAAPGVLASRASANAALPAPVAIDAARVAAVVEDASKKRIAEIVKGHSSESAGLLKSWIREAS